MARTAHPRLRGEHYPCAASAEVDSGSSPLTRGARCRAAFHVGVERLIPAYAGSTNSPVASGGGVAAHPRLRGEHPSTSNSGVVCWGSSPLTRGARDYPLGDRKPDRLIPAYAGSTNATLRPAWGCWAHPRLRGEHFRFGSLTGRGGGSSPLTRGAQNTRPNAQTMMWLIPAYAGSTTWNLRCWIQWWAHPRLRGEHWPIFHCRKLACGSSPLTRGARCHAAVGSRAWGLIPAYAGSTANYRR